MKKETRFSYFEAAGISASALILALRFAEGGIASFRAIAPAAALLLSASLVFIRKEELREIIGLAGYLLIGIAGVALPFVFSPALSYLMWMASLLFMCPLLVGIFPVLATGILAAADIASLGIVFFSGTEIVGGRIDILEAAAVLIISAIIAVTARKAQETDSRRHARTIELLEDEKKELATGSMTDPLTGLFNKGYYEMILPKMISVHDQHGLPLVAIFVDIDHFKAINDTYGHDMGDKALVALADVLQKYFRREEIIRFGGEEFLMLLNVDAFTALKRMEAVRQHIEAMETDGIRYTISAGIAEYKNEMLDDHALAKAADEMMYKAKQTGRNRICM